LLAAFVLFLAGFGCCCILAFDGRNIRIITIGVTAHGLAGLAGCRFLAVTTAAPPPLAPAFAG
ncbi:hypothetical protein, partial [Clostridioides difficile]